MKFISNQSEKEFLNDKHKHGLFKNVTYEPMYNLDLINNDINNSDGAGGDDDADDYYYVKNSNNISESGANDDFNKAISQTNILNRNIVYAKLSSSGDGGGADGDQEESKLLNMFKSTSSGNGAGLVSSVKDKFVSSFLSKINRLKD